MPVPKQGRARGFALPVVMVTLTALGAIAVSVIPKGAVGIGDAISVERRVHERLLLEAGLTRGVLALISPDDPMTEALRREDSVTWTFAGQVLTLSVRAESAKLDLAASDPGALAATLDRSLGPELGREVFATAMANRDHLTDPTLALPLAQRFSPAGARLRDALTVYGGRLGDERLIDVTTSDAPTASGSERPIYTVRAWFAGHPRARAVTVLVEPEGHRYVVLEYADFDATNADPSQ